MMTDPQPPISPNEVADRAAMGLPAHFVERRPATLGRELCRFAGQEAAAAAVAAGDPGEPFARRYAAGLALALLGDPRIRPLDPAMVDVPGARVTLGLDEERAPAVAAAWAHVGVTLPWILKECPRYTLDIAPFRLMRYLVTNLEYRDFLAGTGFTELPTSWAFGVYPAHAANQPVWTVSPQAADAYAAWLRARTGRRFRLPSEAEWEYSASGGDGREYPWGDRFDGEAANTVEAGPLTTTPVGIYPAGRSPFGADDLGGNVEEYTADDYGPYPGGRLVEDDLLVRRGPYRVARGGSFTRYGDLTRCTRRHGWYEKPIYAMGFRLAEDP